MRFWRPFLTVYSATDKQRKKKVESGTVLVSPASLCLTQRKRVSYDVLTSLRRGCQEFREKTTLAAHC